MILWNVVVIVTDFENYRLQTIINLIYCNLEIKFCNKYWENSSTQINMKKKWEVILTWEFGRETSFSANLIPSRNILKWKNQDVLKCQDVKIIIKLNQDVLKTSLKNLSTLCSTFFAKTDKIPMKNVLDTTWKGL